MVKPIDISEIVNNQDELARFIAERYMEWEAYRNSWMAEKQELRDYIFATDTRTTSNSPLPWKNSVHIPKLCQIRDNLHANYMATLFPNDDAIVWEGDDESSDAKQKRLAIQGYMSNKLRQSDFRTEVSKLVLDWIDWGNAFGRVYFINRQFKNELGETVTTYQGPEFRRISPTDIVFDPTVASFENAPKIVRSIKTLATLAAEIEDDPSLSYFKQALQKSYDMRKRVASISQGEAVKNHGYQMDGFGNWYNYFRSDSVEVLEYFGDIYDGSFVKKNQRVVVIDRCYVAHQETYPTWNGQAPIFHVGWRLRPDNLYAMGPLDNLVGMQYRIDHLENAKSDAYDLIIFPVMKVNGFVEEFDYAPGERIYTSEEGDVEFMRPDTTMLSADTQIELYERKMEEMAGAPKQAMGLRSPGEKTAFEVQVLENSANRIFLNKTSYFEEVFLEKVLNCMLQEARRNLGLGDLIRVMDTQYGITSFLKVTQEDLTATGKLRPIGARHFARNANILQNLVQFASSPLGQDTSVATHISGKAIAFLVEELLGLEKYQLVQDNIRVAETVETQQLMQAGQQILAEHNGAANASGLDQRPPQGQAGGVQGPPQVQQNSA